jgi:hypothetical protein
LKKQGLNVAAILHEQMEAAKMFGVMIDDAAPEARAAGNY